MIKALYSKTFLFGIILLLSFPGKIFSQCTGGNASTTITPTTAWQMINVAGNRYYPFAATAGTIYEFSFCTTDGGASTYDTQITLLDNTGTPVVGGYNDDYCSTQSRVSWTCPTTGTYRCLVTKFSCSNQNNMGTLAYRKMAPPTCPSGLGSGVTNIAALPYASGAGTTCGNGNDITSSNSLVCGSSSYYGGEDNVWVFTPATSGIISVNLTSSGSYTGLMLYQGCPFNGQGGTCVTNSQSYTGNKSFCTSVTAGQTYYLVLDSWPSPTCNAYSNLTISAPAASPPCSTFLGTGIVNIASLPYSSTGNTTCGMVDDLNSSNTVVCGSSSYLGGEDVVYVFTPSTTGQMSISLTSTGTYTSLNLFEGCPISNGCTTSGTCVANEQSSTGSKSLCANVTAGTTYYLIVDSWLTSCNPYDISFTAPGPIPAGAVCSTAPSISLPYSATGQTTACYGNDYSNASTGSCGSLYESGEDRVYALTVSSSQCIGITLSNASTTSIGFQVYSGCPGSVSASCIGNFGGSNPLTGTVTLPSAGTYYIVVDNWATPNNCTYDIAVTSFGSGPANDLPCNAATLALNTNLTGDNSCSSGASEPGAPACWTSGNLNTVWYSVICPSSGQLKIRTTLGTCSNTQIALYSGTCSSLTMVACNDDAPSCGSSSYYNSEITATGLTSGATYYIRVDGTYDLTGTFDIMAVDGSVGFPPAAGQDCSSPNPVCNQNIAVGNPGYQAYGNICDFSGSGICLASGERGSAWYNIPINANGFLEFDIVPNDYTGGSGCCSTDYDFAIWKVAGSGSTTCAGIAAGAIPISCNYSGLGVTGCFSNANGTSPAAYPGYGGAYMSRISVTNGEVYELVVSNFSNSTSGFTLNFSATSPINYTAGSSSVVWSGGTNTSWALASNWGGCNYPICGVDATVGPSSTNQPVLTAGNYYVNNLTISPGGTLTLQSGANLHICGNLTNYGSIVANAGSTVTFDNAAVNQSLTGSFVGNDKLGNLVINKTGGSVTLNNDVDLGGSFTSSSNTSVLNMNGKYLKVAGNFTNFNGGSTVTNTAGSTLEFNGTAAQTYNQGNSSLVLNNVVMNHTGTGVTAATNMTLGTSGVLTLTLGKIITNANEVQVTNTASAACTAGNTSSFVQGNLRRYLNGAATSYDFPVGHATKGYQRANITFTSATAIPQLLAYFTAWGTIPTGPNASECPTNTYDVLPALDNGYWTITASANATSGTYYTTLYSTNYTNSSAAAGWTVMKATTGSGPWSLNGTCVGTSTPSNTQRSGMNGFSAFAVAQSTQPLPIELIGFTGTAMADYNHLAWSTATETNNHYFTVERSTNGFDFFPIGTVQGAGNSTQQRNYSLDDTDPANGMNYYRLKQTDYNGQSTYSSIVSLDFHRGNMAVNNVRPNPTSGAVDFDFSCQDETEIHFVITDMTGRIVADERRHVKAGTTTINTMINEAGAGVYSLKVIEDVHGFVSVTRIVKY